MSVPASGGVPIGGAGEEAVELPAHGDAAFGALMDALAPEPEGAPAAEAAPADGGAAEAPAVPGVDAGSGRDETAGPAAGGDPQPAAESAGGAADGTGDQGAPAGDPGQPAADSGAADRPAAWTADAATLVPKLGELKTALEENTTKAYQNAAFEEVRGEYTNYFDALGKHPRLLVGTEVPAIGREGMEVLKSTDDARDWQEAVKSILVQEVNDRAGRRLEESSDFLSNVHASIELFQNNADLVPGTKDFDVELANRFATLAAPYELRVEGKLQGYSIPVQPIINQLRTQISSERAAKTAAPPAAAPTTAAPSGGAAPARPPADPPQAGIPSKAGNSGNKEDFSTLFGTIGLPNLQI